MPDCTVEWIPQPSDSPAGGSRHPKTFRTDGSGQLELPFPGKEIKVRARKNHLISSFETVFAYKPSVTLELSLYPVATIEGRVLEVGTSKPLAHAEVWIQTFGRSSMVKADESGFYEFGFMPMDDQSYILYARAPDHALGTAAVHCGFHGSWESESRQQDGPLDPSPVHPNYPLAGVLDKSRFNLATGDSLPVKADLFLLPELAIKGIVVDPSGNPLEGVRVDALGYFLGPNAGLGLQDKATEKTDGEGFFLLSGLRPDSLHRLGFHATSFALKRVDIPPGASGLIDLGVLPMEPGARVHGQVLDHQGHPVSGVQVDIRSTSLGQPSLAKGKSPDLRYVASGRPLESATTSLDGSFQFETLLAGEFKIRVSDGGFRLHEETLHFSGNGPGSEEPLKFILPQSLVSVEGRLLLGQKGVSGAQVELGGPYGIVRKVPTHENGRFRFSGLPVQGPFQVQARWTDPDGIPWKAASKVDAPNSDLLLQLHKVPGSR